MPTNTTAARTVGDKMRWTVTITDSSGTATDSDVTFIVQPPTTSVAATVAAATSTSGGNGITHVTTGVWYYEHTSTEAGDYKWWMRSTGAVMVSTGGRVAVKAPFASS